MYDVMAPKGKVTVRCLSSSASAARRPSKSFSAAADLVVKPATPTKMLSGVVGTRVAASAKAKSKPTLTNFKQVAIPHARNSAKAMPEREVRFHPKFPRVPLVRREIVASEDGKWLCDVTNTPARVGNVIWSNREQDVDVLDIAFQSASSSVQSELRGKAPSTAVGALNITGMELLSAALKGSKNTFVSPLSISLALSMTANGAQGPTLEGMMAALCMEGLGGIAAINEQMQALTSVLKSSDPRVTFHVANSLWSRTLLKTFIGVCASVYDAEAIKEVPDATAINSWCALKTENKIDSIVQPPLDPEGAVLVNALYFKGEWKAKFDVRRTKPAPFFDSFGGHVDCQMMTAMGDDKNKFAYLETDIYQMACLPYGDSGEYSAVIVLPRADASSTLEMSQPGSRVVGAACNPRPATLLEVLMNVTTALEDKFQSIKGTLQFPRFKVESEMQLAPLLAARGMHLAFTSGADFGGMSSADLCIDKVIHKTFIEVNEEGTEAAAVTSVSMKSKCLPPAEPVFNMVCNRPFLFLIRHVRTKAIIFAGAVLKPE